MASHPEMPVHQLRIGLEFGRRALEHDLALDQDDDAVGHGRDLGHALVDQQRRDAAVADQADGVPDLVADERREAFGRLVEDQHARVGQQRARDREHLLLAAGELVAAIAQPLAEPRKQLEHARDGPRVRCRRSPGRSAIARFSRTRGCAKMPRPSGT